MSATGRAILAAGGVVWRVREGGREVLLAHRPRYDDWTLPKGKLHTGEPALLAAVREVGEEVGAKVAVQRRIGTVHYAVGPATKRVTYWAMRHLGGDFRPNGEVDEVRWLALSAAGERLSYDADRRVIEDFGAVPVPESVLVLVRHARAGKRSEWRGDDRLRPLDPVGAKQADRLAELLSLFAPTGIHAADLARCVQTVEPLATLAGLPVQLAPDFADERYDGGPDGTHTTLLGLARPGTVTVVCSQGVTVPSLIDRLGPGVESDTRKGAFWVLLVVDGEVVALDRYDAP